MSQSEPIIQLHKTEEFCTNRTSCSSQYFASFSFFFSFGIFLHLRFQFLEFGEEVCGKIVAAGYWADYIDPCSGLPMLTKSCNKVYSEVDGMECLLNYRAYNAGFCKVLTHPKWGSAVYPATIFCYAPRQVVAEILNGQYI